MTRNFGWTTFGRTEKGREADYADLLKRLEDQGKKATKQSVAANANPTTNSPQAARNPVSVKAKIDLAAYVQVGMNGIHGNPVLISRYELANSGNMNYDEAHKFVLKHGLYIPTPAIFMTHFNNVVDAYKERSKKNMGRVLLDGNGKPLPDSEIEDLYLHLTKNHKNQFGRNDVGAWTWLNARFVKGSGPNGLDLETVLGADRNGNFKKDVVPLDSCAMNDFYVNLDFNSQGMAQNKCIQQRYLQGENIHFWYSRENCVAGFCAYSDGAVLFCYRDPSHRNDSLGVFACVENFYSSKSKGKK